MGFWKSGDELLTYTLVLLYLQPVVDTMALSIISAVGCGLSIFCLVLTIIAYFLVWR